MIEKINSVIRAYSAFSWATQGDSVDVTGVDFMEVHNSILAMTQNELKP